jgi:uncharacterized membrane protein
LAAGVEAGAALIIALAALQVVARTILLFARPVRSMQAKESVRLSFAGWLALALEFELAADILRTAVAPTWNDIGQLAAIAILRTALNYFVQKEIDRAGMRQDGQPVSES